MVRRWTTALAAFSMVLAACGDDIADNTTTTEAVSEETTATSATDQTTTTAEPASDPLDALADLDEMTVIVNQSAGGGADTAIRILEPALEEVLGMDVLVENVTESGGVAGANEVFAAEPDGSVVGALLIPRTIQQQVLLDTQYETDGFAPILLFRKGSFALTVSADSPYQDFQQLVDASNENAVSVGVTGPGSATDLQTAVVGDVAGAQFIRVPFDGAAGVQTAVLGNNVDAGMLPLNADIVQDQYRILIVPIDETFEAYPDLPVMGDLGLPSADVSFYQGIFGPEGMSDEVRIAVEAAFRMALDAPEVKEQYDNAGYFTVSLSGADMTALIDEQRLIIDQYIDLLRGE